MSKQTAHFPLSFFPLVSSALYIKTTQPTHYQAATSMIVKLALLFVCVALASGNPAAGKPWTWKSPKPLMTPIGPVKSSRIVGGSETAEHAYPHQVALYIDDTYFCGGSLISTEWVLTAAHCMDGARTVEVVLGAHNIRQDEASQVTLTSTDFTVHENYGPLLIRNDIAVIRLPQAVTLNAYIDTVALASSDPSTGTYVTPTGWGLASDSAITTSPVLREVDVPILGNVACDLVYGVVTDGNICIDGSGGKGTCSGDSGGPLNYNGQTIGITSFGAAAGCEEGYPDAFTRITYFLDWIEENTGVTP